MDDLEKRDWITLCREYVESNALANETVQILEAFHAKDGKHFSAESFQALQSYAQEALQALPENIIETLDGEIDRPQAELFSRRFVSVIQLLRKQAKHVPEATLLKIGLVMRARQILDAPMPRALRVRAVVDFYYTQAAIIHHRPKDATKIHDYKTLLDQTPWQEIGAGSHWKTVEGLTAFGPIHVNVLRLKKPRLRAVDCRTSGPGLSLKDFANQQSAMAAVSGGFFLYSEPDIQAPSQRTDPVGFLMDNATIQNPPVLNRATIMQTQGGQTIIQRLGPKGLQFQWPGSPVFTIESHNELTALSAQSFNRAYGISAPAGGLNCVVVGNQVVEVSAGELAIPLAGMVIKLQGNHAPQPGSNIKWSGHAIWEGDPLHTAMAGGPMLLEDHKLCINREIEDFQKSAPPVTFSQDETFDQNLLPRMAAGLNAEGELFFAAIDGRNFHKAPGMTLKQTAEWMQALGCAAAMNLDGGSSKRMVVNQEVVDLSSTEVVGSEAGEESVRPVHSAILIYPGT